jgi:membrane protease subunit HflC
MTRGRIFTIAGLIVAGLLIIVAFLSVYIVDPTKYALVLRFGEPVAASTEPGLYFKVPFIDNVVYIEKRLIGFAPSAETTRNEANEIVAGDQRRINVLAFGRYRVLDPLVFYQAVGTVEVANSRLLAILDASVRSILGDANFQEIVRDDRDALMQSITQRVANEARSLGVEVVDVRIQRVDLPDVNANAIYARMQTERQQEAAQIRADGEQAAREIRAAADRDVTVTVANAQRDAQTLRGAGDAEANRLYAQAYGVDVDFFQFYRSMQAYQDGLPGDTTTMLLSPTGEFFRFFNQLGTIESAPPLLNPDLLPEVPEVSGAALPAESAAGSALAPASPASTPASTPADPVLESAGGAAPAADGAAAAGP